MHAIQIKEPAAAEGAHAPELEFVQPVPRHLVHRAAISTVLLTDSVRLGEHHFLVAAQWPRDHAVLNPDTAGRVDPLLFAETIRQMFVYLPHTYYGIPLTHRFIGDALDFDLDQTSEVKVGGAPLNVVLDAEWNWTAGHRAPNRYAMRLDVVLSIDGRVCGRGSISGIAVDDRRYALLRRRTAPGNGAVNVQRTAVAPARVGRLRSKDCVLEEGARAGDWWLRVDTEHATYFDHPSDHVPLMVALEGFRQLGYLLVNRDQRETPLALVNVSVECLAFGELDEAPRLVIEEASEPFGEPGLRRLRVSACQGGRPFVTATMLWGRPDAPGSANASDATDGAGGLAPVATIGRTGAGAR